MSERLPAVAASISAAVRCLRAGGVVAFPTDTLYAVGARAEDPVAVRRMYSAKRRPESQPAILLVADAAAVEPLARVSSGARALMERFWPGPLTLVLAAAPGLAPATVAVRAPDHPVALALLRALGEPISSSSANPAGVAPPVDAAEVERLLGDSIDLILDGGPCRLGLASTILDLSGDAPRVLRPGAIPEADLIPR